jgi:hypothetical protein
VSSRCSKILCTLQYVPTYLGDDVPYWFQYLFSAATNCRYKINYTATLFSEYLFCLIRRIWHVAPSCDSTLLHLRVILLTVSLVLKYQQLIIKFYLCTITVFHLVISQRPSPVAAQSKACTFGRSLAGIVGSNPTGGMDVCLLYTVCVSGRGLCVGLITPPEESYRLLCVSECDQVKNKNLGTCCEQVGRRGEDYETISQSC